MADLTNPNQSAMQLMEEAGRRAKAHSQGVNPDAFARAAAHRSRDAERKNNLAQRYN